MGAFPDQDECSMDGHVKRLRTSGKRRTGPNLRARKARRARFGVFRFGSVLTANLIDPDLQHGEPLQPMHYKAPPVTLHGAGYAVSWREKLRS